jgi:pSer/pThr/pTyr-binding forkhead associated (FHA) protein
MIICRACGAQNAVNSVFCEECGHNLLEQLDNPAGPAEPPEAEKAHSRPKLVRVIILNNGRTIDMPYGHDILIGRRDAPRGIVPEVDLANEGGFEAGVSRRHAQIGYQEEQALIQDLASTNGTLLNRKLLTPYLPEPLQHGDEVTLGSCTLRVEFR